MAGYRGPAQEYWQGAARVLAYHLHNQPMLVNQPHLWCLQWAHVRDLVQELAGCYGPARAHRQGTAYSSCGPMHAFLADSCPGASCRKYYRWAHASIWLAGLHGPTRTYGLLAQIWPMLGFPIHPTKLHVGFTNYYDNICYMGSR